jgi:hypothetical protein
VADQQLHDHRELELLDVRRSLRSSAGRRGSALAPAAARRFPDALELARVGVDRFRRLRSAQRLETS